MGVARIVGLTVCLCLFGAACGGGTETIGEPTDVAPASGEAERSPIVADPAVLLAARNLEASFGLQDAVIAVVSAMERGYETAAIIDAAAANGLSGGGVITGAGGATIAPTAPRAGVFELVGGDEPTGDALGPSSLDGGAVEVELVGFLQDAAFTQSDLRSSLNATKIGPLIGREVLDQDGESVGDTALLVVILELAQSGYSLDQIIEWLVLQDDDVTLTGASDCLGLEDSDFRRIRPRGSGSGTCGPATRPPVEPTAAATTEPEPEPEVQRTPPPNAGAVYEGFAQVELIWPPGDSPFLGTECFTNPAVRLEVDAEGGAMLRVVWAQFVRTPGTGEGCREVTPPYDFATVGRITGDQLSITVRSPLRGAEAPVVIVLSEGRAELDTVQLKWPAVDAVPNPPTGSISFVLTQVG